LNGDILAINFGNPGFSVWYTGSVSSIKYDLEGDTYSRKSVE
jgi:hypothetical protein